jgi:hypothetical protein
MSFFKLAGVPVRKANPVRKNTLVKTSTKPPASSMARKGSGPGVVLAAGETGAGVDESHFAHY